ADVAPAEIVRQDGGACAARRARRRRRRRQPPRPPRCGRRKTRPDKGKANAASTAPSWLRPPAQLLAPQFDLLLQLVEQSFIVPAPRPHRARNRRVGGGPRDGEEARHKIAGAFMLPLGT